MMPEKASFKKASRFLSWSLTSPHAHILKIGQPRCGAGLMFLVAVARRALLPGVDAEGGTPASEDLHSRLFLTACNDDDILEWVVALGWNHIVIG